MWNPRYYYFWGKRSLRKVYNNDGQALPLSALQLAASNSKYGPRGCIPTKWFTAAARSDCILQCILMAQKRTKICQTCRNISCMHGYCGIRNISVEISFTLAAACTVRFSVHYTTMPFYWVCLKLCMLRRHCVPHWQCHPTTCSCASRATAFASACFHRVLIFRGCNDIDMHVSPCEIIDDGCAGCNLNKCKGGVWRPSRKCHICCMFFLFSGLPALLLSPILYFALPWQSYFLTFILSLGEGVITHKLLQFLLAVNVFYTDRL